MPGYCSVRQDRLARHHLTRAHKVLPTLDHIFHRRPLCRFTDGIPDGGSQLSRFSKAARVFARAESSLRARCSQRRRPPLSFLDPYENIKFGLRESMVDCLRDQLIPPASLLVSRRGFSELFIQNIFISYNK